MTKENINNRFKDAPWYEVSKSECIHLCGLGGIGSNALYYLTKTIPATYYIQDFDKVEYHNVGTQFYRKSNIGEYKVSAIANIMQEFCTPNIKQLTEKFVKNAMTMKISIAAFDNMQARKDLFNAWKNTPNKELFIDGRLRASLYEIYVVTPDRINEYEKTLFDDSEADDDQCTFKQTAYFAGLIGARITHVLVNYLTNKYAKEDICNLPFKIEEIGEPLYINIK